MFTWYRKRKVGKQITGFLNKLTDQLPVGWTVDLEREKGYSPATGYNFVFVLYDNHDRLILRESLWDEFKAKYLAICTKVK